VGSWKGSRALLTQGLSVLIVLFPLSGPVRLADREEPPKAGRTAAMRFSLHRHHETPVTGIETGGLTVAEVMALPAVTDLISAGKALGIGRTRSYELARAGDSPVQ
jgi:hypothetical protein